MRGHALGDCRSQCQHVSTLTIDLLIVNLQSMSSYVHCRGGMPTSATDLPYEFLALEVALTAVCKALDFETNEVEARVGPALDNLAQKVYKKDLEDVRHLKTRLNRVFARASKVKQVCPLNLTQYPLDTANAKSNIHLQESW